MFLLLFYVGGLSTSFAALWSNIYLSGLVALIGISAPITLSFVLLQLINATPVQAFAAGAALCSTSLGTTFTILSTSGLDKSRLGVILSSAAMLDDVAGLVMVQVISNLGGGSEGFSAVTVIRPVFVSIAFAVIVPAICWAVIRPITKHVFSTTGNKTQAKGSKLKSWICSPVGAFSGHTLVLLALVTGSTYAGTSNLFAAYIAGAVVNWWDSLVNTTLQECKTGAVKGKKQSKKVPARNEVLVAADSPSSSSQNSASQENSESNARQSPQPTTAPHHHPTGAEIYERFYAPGMTAILKPFFFVRIYTLHTQHSI